MALGRTPEPSKLFHSIALPISGIDREWYRSHPVRRGAIYFGRNRAYRFDAPEGEYGVLYVGADPHVAFIESFQIAGIHPAVTESKLRQRSVSRIRTRGPARLVDLADSGALTPDRSGCADFHCQLFRLPALVASDSESSRTAGWHSLPAPARSGAAGGSLFRPDRGEDRGPDPGPLAGSESGACRNTGYVRRRAGIVEPAAFLFGLRKHVVVRLHADREVFARN